MLFLREGRSGTGRNEEPEDFDEISVLFSNDVDDLLPFNVQTFHWVLLI
jgi:hypothetical protein